MKTFKTLILLTLSILAFNQVALANGNSDEYTFKGTLLAEEKTKKNGDTMTVYVLGRVDDAGVAQNPVMLPNPKGKPQKELVATLVGKHVTVVCSGELKESKKNVRLKKGKILSIHESDDAAH